MAMTLRRYWETLFTADLQASPDRRKEFFTQFFVDDSLNKQSDFWLDIALLGVTDSWSHIRRIAIREIVQSTKVIVRVERLQCPLVAPWFHLEGLLSLLAELQLAGLTCIYSENSVLSLALRFVLPCVVHTQLPVRDAAVRAAVTIAAKMESFSMFLRSFVSQKLEESTMLTSSTAYTLEGVLSLALAARCESSVKPACLTRLIGNDSSTVRQHVAVVLSREEAVGTLVQRLLGNQDSTNWESSETLLMAIGTKLQECLEQFAEIKPSDSIETQRRDIFETSQMGCFVRLAAHLSQSRQFEVQRMAKQVMPLYTQFAVRNAGISVETIDWPDECFGLLAWLLTIARFTGAPFCIPTKLLQSTRPDCLVILFTYHHHDFERLAVEDQSPAVLLEAWAQILKSSGLLDDERFLPDFCSRFAVVEQLLPLVIATLGSSTRSHTQCHLLEALRVSCLETGAPHKLLQFAWDVDRAPPTNKDGGDAVPRGIHWLKHALTAAPVSHVVRGLDCADSFASICKCIRIVALRKDTDPCVVVRCWDIAAQLYHRRALSYDDLAALVTERLLILFPHWRNASPLPPSPSKGSGSSLQSELLLLRKWFCRAIPDYITRDSLVDLRQIFDKIVE